MTAIIVITGLLLIIAIRTLLFVPQTSEEDSIMSTEKREQKGLLGEREIFERFRKLLQIETVVDLEDEVSTKKRFDAFKKSLEELFPSIYSHLQVEYIHDRGILMYWKGISQERPSVIMAHYDVVPAKNTEWDHDPFEAYMDATHIWGRGTIDDKNSVGGILEALSQLINIDFQPQYDLYISLSGDEEVSGQSTPEIVRILEKKGVRPYMVVDEGGAVLSGVFPGVKKSCAFVGIGEKGYIDMDISFRGEGGHSSTPPSETLTESAARLIMTLKEHPFKAHLSKPVKILFDRIGRHSTWPYRVVFSNLWLFWPLLKLVFHQKGGPMNALIRSTVSVTKMQGSQIYNVLPTEVILGANIRLLKGDRVEEVVKRIKNILGKKGQVKVIESNEASPYTPIESHQWSIIEESIRETFRDIVISPYLMSGISDSRHYIGISNHILRFSPMSLTDEELSCMHGNNERITKESYIKGISFYHALIQKL